MPVLRLFLAAFLHFIDLSVATDHAAECCGLCEHSREVKYILSIVVCPAEPQVPSVLLVCNMVSREDPPYDGIRVPVFGTRLITFPSLKVTVKASSLMQKASTRRCAVRFVSLRACMPALHKTFSPITAAKIP